MNILIIDGQGGRMGRSLVEEIRKICPEAVITAVGTNSIATGNMMKANAADHLATGENAVITACRKAQIIVGPIGIVAATGSSPMMWVGIVLLCFVLPAVLSLLFAELMRKIGWIRPGWMKLEG